MGGILLKTTTARDGGGNWSKHNFAWKNKINKQYGEWPVLNHMGEPHWEFREDQEKEKRRKRDESS